MTLNAPMAGWYCDIGSRGYAFRSLIAELESQKPDYKRFSSKIKQRNALPPCPGEGNPLAPSDSAGPHFTYEAIDGKSGVFCQGCFWDKVLGTSMEPFFNAYTELDRQYYGDVPCELSSLASVFAMKAAIRARDDEVWRRCMEGRARLPACVGIEGVDEETLQNQEETQWYCYTKHPSIEVCSFCYCANVELLGASHLFSPVERPLRSGVIRYCHLAQANDLNADVSDAKNFENTLVWRGTMLRNWLHQGYDWHGNFYGLKHVVNAIADWPPPCSFAKRMIKPINERKWYGNHFLAEGDETKLGICVCEECYEHYIKDSPLEWFVGVDLSEKTNNNNPNGFICNSSSKRAKAELENACKQGNFHLFAAYYAQRRECEARWKAIDAKCQEQAERQARDLMVLNMQNQQAAINLMGQLNANMNATIRGVGGSVAEAAATNYGQKYGNSTVGYGYLTSNGAAAAQAHADAQNLRKGMSVADFHPSGDTLQDTQNLLAISRAIQAEWQALE